MASSTYSNGSPKPTPEELEELYSNEWAQKQVSEIKRWAHTEHVPERAEEIERALLEHVVKAIQLGHPHPRSLCHWCVASLNENFPRTVKPLEK